MNGHSAPTSTASRRKNDPNPNTQIFFFFGEQETHMTASEVEWRLQTIQFSYSNTINYNKQRKESEYSTQSERATSINMQDRNKAQRMHTERKMNFNLCTG